MRLHFIFLVLLGACSQFDHLGVVPEFTPTEASPEFKAMVNSQGYDTLSIKAPNEKASLWSRNRQSLLGDRRVMSRGDILTVLVEIDDSAEISNSSSRQRQASETLGIPQLFGIPQRNSARLPDGASFDSAVNISSTSQASGDGNVKRKEKLTLRIAATILDVLPNGVLAISGSQEVRVNYEIRELIVTGFVRPEDISRQNQITYDKIASARVSYGGRGHISDMQEPRIGYQVLDAISPF